MTRDQAIQAADAVIRGPGTQISLAEGAVLVLEALGLLDFNPIDMREVDDILAPGNEWSCGSEIREELAKAGYVIVRKQGGPQP